MQPDSADKAGASFARLSGGQRQRLFVALALVNSPGVGFLDEMTQGLDPAAQRVAWELIRQLRERGTTVVLVTHYLHVCVPPARLPTDGNGLDQWLRAGKLAIEHRVRLDQAGTMSGD